jgi:GNAT superfamily N-acetyltransferase
VRLDGGLRLTWRREIFEAYCADRRDARIPGYDAESGEDVIRHLSQGGGEAMLWLPRFTALNADRRIAEEHARLAARGFQAQWKLHELEEPFDLKRRLEAGGCVQEEPLALMILDVATAPRRSFEPTDVVVKEACVDELDDVAALGEEVWNETMPWLRRSLREMTHPARGTAKVFCARTAERVVGSGWIEFHGASRFAQLCGGSLLESHRGRGLYSRLFERRVDEARARSVPYIAVDASAMSRPILERRGFRYVCATWFMRAPPATTTKAG